jgi:hypothetical protein
MAENGNLEIGVSVDMSKNYIRFNGIPLKGITGFDIHYKVKEHVPEVTLHTIWDVDIKVMNVEIPDSAGGD